ncbi:hypothetical protein TNCT_625151 [Trichonephila clavata]|uniref:Uncharacterized protein n=1 Tax=Trichonephila clavata TaxID=2740835 RepID=A0A8X6H4H8_TRICU|nr:hypothetical protein TNCT_625151 [Trichonephila clavata]
MPRNCVNNPYKFCYACGEITFAAQKRTICPVVKSACFFYFRVKVGELGKPWAPYFGQERPFAVFMHSISHSTGSSSVDMPIPDSPKEYQFVNDYVEEEEFIRIGTTNEQVF